MRQVLLSVSCLALGLAAGLRAEELRVAITADNSICAHHSEVGNNMGKSARIKMKGIENIMIFNFDPKPLEGKVVTKAVLHIKGSDNKMMVRKVGFSTIATAWNEGSIEGDAPANKGDSTFKSPETGSDRAWAYPGADFLSAVFGRGSTFWMQSYVKPGADLWYDMEFDGRILEACAAGLSHGFAVSDDNGQTARTHKDVIGDGNFGNNFFFSREQNNAQPELVLTVSPAEIAQAGKLDVTVNPWPGGSDFETGGLEIVIPSGADLGYRITLDGKELPRWQHPPVAPKGEAARALIKGLASGAKVKVEVKSVGRGGVVMAVGTAEGQVSEKLAPPAAIALEPITREAGDPPANAQGRVWAMPDVYRANPVTGNVLEEPGVNYGADAAGAFSKANAAWSGKDRTVSLNALRGEWIAFQLVCQNAGADPVEYSVEPGALKGPGDAAIPAAAFQLSRAFYIKAGKTDRDWYADPLLPLKAGESFKVPDEKNAVPGQANQAVYAECFVPKDAAPGEYKGTFTVKAGAGEPLALNVSLTVLGAVIPDTAHFVWSMNAYGTPASPYGAVGSDEFIAAEHAFYGMSHLHRTCLAILHYSHSGRQAPGTALAFEGSGKDLKVKDWSAWDKRFGPILDGSIFKGTPREGTAMDHFYLVLSENYPTTMQDGYKWNDSVWEDHWKVAGPVEEGFSQQYKDQWVAAAREMLKHFVEKGYTSNFQVYLNDKYFYKQYDGNKKARGQGTSFWLLDEPANIDDYTALALFGKFYQQAKKEAGPAAEKLGHYRVDVSRPQWGRDTLDRITDLNVCGGFGEYRPWLEEWRERYGQRVWTYGGAPAITSSGLGTVMHALDLYGRGVDGFVPWLTLGGESAWTKYDGNCVFYTGKPMGVMGPCASLRLKSYRRAEQDVEYVYLLAEKRGLLKGDPNRLRVGHLVSNAIKATKKLGKLDAEGAVTESFEKLKPEDFEQLRIALAKALGE
ncbi:MAG: hypothetical protein KIS92_10600 [Planctomycetota bacterium]|nr:hypothetical protein [Planctomycetota bacterium]